MRQESVQRLARRPLADPADRSGHSAHLSVLHGREVVYVIEERAPGRVRLITDVGARLPAHTTASGRAMLAELPPAQVRALYPSAKDLLGSALPGPRTPIELRRALSDVRSAGVASDEGEVTPGQASLARDGQPITAQLTEEPSRTAVAEQKLGMRRPAVPVLVTENVLDDVIPYAVGRGVAERWWDRGDGEVGDQHCSDPRRRGVAAFPSRSPSSRPASPDCPRSTAAGGSEPSAPAVRDDGSAEAGLPGDDVSEVSTVCRSRSPHPDAESAS